MHKQIVLLTLLGMASVAFAVDGEYAPVEGEAYHKTHKKPDCAALGSFLPHPSDDCRYLRCDYGDDYKGGKNVVYSKTEMICPPGTQVDRKDFNIHNPCSYHSETCTNIYHAGAAKGYRYNYNYFHPWW